MKKQLVNKCEAKNRRARQMSAGAYHPKEKTWENPDPMCFSFSIKGDEIRLVGRNSSNLKTSLASLF